VAYNAVFSDLGDLSKPEYLIAIVKDAIGDEPPIKSMKGIIKPEEDTAQSTPYSILARIHDYDMEP